MGKVEDGEGSQRNKQTAIETLWQATAVITVQVLFQRRTIDATLVKLVPRWEWFIANRKRLRQAAGEGFYRGPDLLVEV